MAEHLTAFASKARTATEVSPIFVNDEGATGAVVVINCTAIVTSPSVVFTVEGYDPSSQTAYTILTSAAVISAAQSVLRIHPDLTAAANTIAKDMIPRFFRITATHADTDSITYSVGVQLV